MNNTKGLILINLDKERTEFESRRFGEFNNVEFEKNKYWDIGHYKGKTNHSDDLEEANEMSYSWFAWVERAVLAQEEINKLKKEEIKYKEKYGKLIGKIHALESKLTDYENPNYVLVPRRPTNEIRKALESGFEFAHSESNYDAWSGYKAMIEAVEEENE